MMDKADTTISRSEISNLKLFWSYLKPDINLFRIAFVFMIVTIFFALLGPLILQIGLDQLEVAFRSNAALPLSSTIVFGLGYFIMVILSWWARAFQILSLSKLSSNTINRLRIDVYQKVLENDLRFFNDQQVGQIVSKVAHDSNEILNFGDRFVFIITNLFILFGVVIIMLFYSVILTFYSLLILPFVFIIIFILRKFTRRASAAWRYKFGLVNASFNENFAGIQIAKSFGREIENYNRFVLINEEMFIASKTRGFWIFINGPIGDFFRHIILILILMGGAIAVFDNRISVTTVFFFVLLVDYFYNPIVQLSNNYQRFQSAFSNLDRMLSIVATQEHRERFESGTSATEIKGNIMFQNLNFSYTKGIPVLRNININIKAGERIAVVGHTGAGKTSLISLLLRLYEIRPETGSSGEIFIDDFPIHAYELRSLRQSISLVSQRIFLFEGSIRDNLLISNPNATDENIWHALKVTQAYEFVSRLPSKLDYNVGENGSHLSIGERQLLAFARALLGNPKILILDEATASVDLYTEALIQEAIEKVLENRTSIVIAHRLTTIINSDRIIVLDQGQIKQVGTHEELLKEEGIYAEVYNTYFKHQSYEYGLKVAPNGNAIPGNPIIR